MESNITSTSKTVRRDDTYWESLLQRESPRDPDVNTGQSSTAPDWDAARRVEARDGTLDLVVRNYNKGGLLVTWKHLPGFVPASQIANLQNFHVKEARENALADYVGRTLSLRIIELDEEANRFILSERAAQAEPDAREQRLAQLEPGIVVTGRITNLADFGAFVDLGGVEGLIHISELSYARVMHPSDVVKPGEELEVLVLNVDHDEDRIGLSLKQVKPDPWLDAEEKYQPEQLVTGTVRRVVSYGAFVRLEPGLDALVHISEMADGSFPHPNYVVREGQAVRGRVLHVDGSKRRLALSMRGVEQPEDDR